MHQHTQQGLTLLEMLVSLTLTCIILALLTDSLVHYRFHLKMQEANHHWLDAMQTLESQLSADVATVGYIGCSSLKRLEGESHAYQLPFNAETALSVTDNHISINKRAFVAAFGKRVLSNARVIVLDDAVNWQVGDMILISNCKLVEANHITAVLKLDAHQVRLTLQAPLKFRYTKWFEAGKWEQHVYSLKTQPDHTSSIYLTNDQRETRVIADQITSWTLERTVYGLHVWIYAKVNQQLRRYPIYIKTREPL